MLDVGALALRLEAVGGVAVRRELTDIDRQAEKTGGTFDKLRGKTKETGSAMAELRQGAALLAAGVGAAGLAASLRASFDAADALTGALRKLEGVSRLTGVPLQQLQGLSRVARDNFKLAGVDAAALASEVGKLGAKAGDLSKADELLRSVLDLGAARGLDAAQSVDRFRMAINGSDEAVEALFAKNPSSLWAEYAARIGTTAGKLTEAQKAQALLTATIESGRRVNGEYLAWLDTAAGKAQQAAVAQETLAAAFGQALDPVRKLGSEVNTFAFTGLRELLQGFQLAALEIGSFFRKLPQWATIGFARTGTAIAGGLDGIIAGIRARGGVVPGGDAITAFLRRGAATAQARAAAAQADLDRENAFVGDEAAKILTGQAVSQGGFGSGRTRNRGGGGGAAGDINAVPTGAAYDALLARARQILAADPTMGGVVGPRPGQLMPGVQPGGPSTKDLLGLGSLDKDVEASLRVGLEQLYDGPILQETARFREMIGERFADVFSGGIVDGISTAVRTGNIGEGFKAMTAGFLSGFGGMLITIGQRAVAASALMLKIRTAIERFTPAAGLAGGLALIALGATMQGAAGAIGSRGGGGVGGSGGFGGSSAIGSGPGEIINRGVIGMPSSTIADGLTRVAAGTPGPNVGGMAAPSAVQIQQNTVWVIGKDPAAWREVQEELNRNARRG